MGIDEVMAAVARGEACTEETSDSSRSRLVVDVPAKPATLLQNWTFGRGGTVPTMDVVWDHFYPLLRNGVDHHESNGEWQRYAADGVSMAEDLKLTASIIDPALGLANGNIRSGMIRSIWNGMYGYWEARMKLSPGNALWPAAWIIAADGPWPPELDIMEQVNSPTEGLHKYHVNTHKEGNGVIAESKLDKWKAYWVGPKASTPLADDYHTYGLEWLTDRVRFYFDDVLVWDRKYKWFDNNGILAGPANLILNLAVGGNWAGAPDNPDVFPATVSVAWARVWDSRPFLHQR